MFDKVCIKAPEKRTHSHIFDFGFFCETLLFYQKTVLLANKDILIRLFRLCSIRGVKELLKSGLLEIHIRENIVGPMIFPVGQDRSDFRYNIDVFTDQKKTYNVILYEAFEIITKDIRTSVKLTDEFLPLVLRHKYPKGLKSQIFSDLGDNNYLRESLALYLGNEVPDLALTSYDINIEITQDNDWNGFPAYRIDSNLPTDTIKQKMGNRYNYVPDEIFSGYLLTLAEARGDIIISSQFDSEVATEEILSKTFRLRLESLYDKFQQSQNNISFFNEKIIPDYHSIGAAINGYHLRFSDFLAILRQANKFKDWLRDKPQDENLVVEYYQCLLKETKINRFPVKVLRFFVTSIASPILELITAGAVAGTISTMIGAADAFLLERLAQGWRPNQFVDNNLKKQLPKKKS